VGVPDSEGKLKPFLTHSAIAIAAAVALSACSTPSTVQGMAPATGESFAGTYYPGIYPRVTDHSSALTFVGSSMALCRGNTTGAGDMTFAIACDDGRTGTITFTGTATKATGTGTLGKDQVTMTMVP